MSSYNRVILVGNVTRDPELRYLQSGVAVAEIGMAVNEKRKGPTGEWIDEVTWIDVTLWGKTAEVAGEYLSKGSPVLIEGRLKTDSWGDKQTGQKRSKLKVVGEKLQLLGGNRGGRASTPPDDAGFPGDDAPAEQPATQQASPAESNDDPW